jgi:hypothetical protein
MGGARGAKVSFPLETQNDRSLGAGGDGTEGPEVWGARDGYFDLVDPSVTCAD